MNPAPALIAQRFGSALTYGILLSILFLYLTVTVDVRPNAAGWYFAVLLFSNQIFALPARVLGRRFGTGKIFIAGSCLNLLAYAILFMFPSSGVAMLACMLLGVGGCLFSSNAQAEILAPSDGQTRQAAAHQGSFLRWTNIGALLGPLLALAVLRQTAIRDLFLICFLAELLFLAVAFRSDRLEHRPIPAPPAFRTMLRQRPPLPFLLQHAIGAFPIALALSAPFVVPYLFATVNGQVDEVAAAQFVRAFIIIAVQGAAIQCFAPTRHVSLCLTVLFAVLTMTICLAVAWPHTATAWIAVIAFGLVQVALGSLTSAIVHTRAADMREDILFAWSKGITACSCLVLLPLFAYLVTGFSEILAHAGPIRRAIG